MSTDVFHVIEIYGLSIDLIVVARVLAIVFFLFVAWRLAGLQRQIKHIEALTSQNYSDLQIKLADAIGVAEDSVMRDQVRNKEEREEEQRADST